MGGQLSQSFTDIKPIKNIGLWKIHSAMKRTTNEKVSLWLIDKEMLNSTFQDKNVRNLYLDMELASVQTMRKIIHPRVLKIFEIDEKKPEIGFASEPVDNMTLVSTEKMHTLDAAYISFQVAETLCFLNDEAHFLYLGLSSRSVLLNNDLSIRLINFHFATQVGGGEITPNPNLFNHRMFGELLPPEYLSKRELKTTSDCFMFGLFVYECLTGTRLFDTNDPQVVLSQLPLKVSNIGGISGEFLNLVKKCLDSSAERRPSFSKVLEDPAFQTLQLKSLRYIDMILTKQPQDKFKFYKGLGSNISAFSPTLLKVKILPVFLQECKNDHRFAPILIPSIFEISKDYQSDEFNTLVWSKIAFLSGVKEPPEVSLCLLKNMWLLIKKLDIKLHKDYVYPIFFNALQSTSVKVHMECLDKMELIVKEMNETSIKSNLIPKLADLSVASNDSNVAVSAVRCLSKCLIKCDHESFVSDYFQKIIEFYSKRQSEQSASAIYELSYPLKANSETMATVVVPLLSKIAGSSIVTLDLRRKICDLVISTMSNLKNVNPQPTMTTSINQANTKEADRDNPFGGTGKQFNSEALDDIFSKASPKQSPVNADFSGLDPMSSLSRNSLSGTSSLSANVGSAMNKTSPIGAPGTVNPSSSAPELDIFFGAPSSNSNPSFNSSFSLPPPPSSSRDQSLLGSSNGFLGMNTQQYLSNGGQSAVNLFASQGPPQFSGTGYTNSTPMNTYSSQSAASLFGAPSFNQVNTGGSGNQSTAGDLFGNKSNQNNNQNLFNF